MSAWFAYKHKTLKMSILKKKEKTLWIKVAHIFVFSIFVLGVFSFYVSNVYSYPGEGILGDATCTDGTDNDSDGYIDGSDSECTDPPSTPDLISASDTGSSNTDNITNLSYPDISVVCQSNYLVKLYMGGVQIGNGVTCSAGVAGFGLFSFVTPLSEGSNTFTATQNNNGETAQSGVLTVTFDTAPPDAPGTPDMTAGTDSGSSSSDNNTSDITPDFTVSCGNGESVLILVDGVESGTSPTCSGDTATVTTGILGEGTYSISSKQIDTAGNESSSLSSISVTIDTSAPSNPTVAPDLYFSSDLGTFSSDDLTSDTTPSFTGTCDAYSVTLFSDGVSVGTAVCSGGNYNVTSSVLSEGSHNMTIVAIDAVGNQSAGSSPALTITIDTTAPTTSGASNMTPDTDSGISSNDDITSNTTPTFTGVCASGSTVQLYDDGVSSGSSAVCSSLAFSLTTGTLATGSNSITFKETDIAGNVSSASTPLSITIDNTAPVISSIASSTITTTGITFTWTTDTSASSSIAYGLDTSYGTISTSTESTSHSVILTGLSAGTTYHYNVLALDTAGNISTSTDATFTTTTATVSTDSGGFSSTQTIGAGGVTTSTTNQYTTPLPILNIASTTLQVQLASTTPTNINTVISATSPIFTTPTQQPSLQTQKQVFINPNGTPFTFTNTLTTTSPQNTDIKKLQVFLNSTGYTIAPKGPGSYGLETNKFGPATKNALLRFQKAVGIKGANGVFGPATRAYVNMILKSVGR